MIRDYYAAGKLNELHNDFLNDSLDEDVRKSLGRIHPTFMGGEYLPGYRRQEVEIARIELQSTTADVISLRVRRSRNRIKYRLVDEYQSEFGLPQQTSQRPFSLREFIAFLDSVEDHGADPSWHRFGFPLLSNEMNFEADPTSEHLETLRDFTRVSSEFYQNSPLTIATLSMSGTPRPKSGYRTTGHDESHSRRESTFLKDLSHPLTNITVACMSYTRYQIPLYQWLSSTGL